MPAYAWHLLCTITASPGTQTHKCPGASSLCPCSTCRASEECGERQLVWTPLWAMTWKLGYLCQQGAARETQDLKCRSRIQVSARNQVFRSSIRRHCTAWHSKPQNRSLLLLNLPWGIPQKEQSLCHVVSIRICYICCWMAFVKPYRDPVLLLLLTLKHQTLAPTGSQTHVKVSSSLSKSATQTKAC